jgi:outer membrane lipoprotein SlyB
MPTRSPRILIAVMLVIASGCASMQRPVLYPNATLARAGPAQAERDIDDCLRRAENHGLTPAGTTRVVRRSAEGAAVGAAAGAAGAAVYGRDVGRAAGTGAAAGAAAGAVRGGFEAADPNPTYRRFVQRCLRDRGYDVIGWQ